MKKLLRRNEKEAIRNKFGILPIFQLLLPAGKKIERELNVFHLSGEQIIIEIICLLDNIREYNEALHLQRKALFVHIPKNFDISKSFQSIQLLSTAL